MANPAIEATDYFLTGLAGVAQFHPQSSSQSNVEDPVQTLDEFGNVECETMLNTRIEYTTEYKYCNATPNIITDLGTALTSYGVLDSKIVNSITITFNAGEYADVSITGVAYSDNSPVPANTVNFTTGTNLPASAGFGVPTPAGVTLGTDAEMSSLTYTFTTNAVTAIDEAGNAKFVENITPRAEVTYESVGVPSTAQPLTGYTTDSYGPSDSNTDFDTYAVSAHANLDVA